MAESQRREEQAIYMISLRDFTKERLPNVRLERVVNKDKDLRREVPRVL